jgi:diamine N-acetyltransferase
MFEYLGVRIRPIEEFDLSDTVGLRATPSVWMNLGTIRMIGRHEQKEWIESLSSNPKADYYILYSKEIPFIGVVRMDEIDYINRSIRVGGDILPVYQGEGYGKSMLELLKKYCFDYLNMNRMWLLVLATNDSAIRLYQNAGFVEEGCQRRAIYRHGCYIDYIMMSLLKSEYNV